MPQTHRNSVQEPLRGAREGIPHLLASIVAETAAKITLLKSISLLGSTGSIGTIDA